MSNIIPFDPNINSKKSPKENEPDRGCWSEHFDENAARCFGTYIEWDDIAVMYLAEQIAGYMNAVDGYKYGPYCAMLAAELILTSYKEENFETIIHNFLKYLKYLDINNSSNAGRNKGNVSKALKEICYLLYEKYPDL